MIGPAGTKPPVSEAIRIPRHPLSGPISAAIGSPGRSFATKPAVTGDGDPRNDRDEALERNLEAKAHGAAPPAQRHQAEHEGEAPEDEGRASRHDACSSRPGGRAASIGSTMATTGNSREINPATSGRGRSQEAQGGELHPHQGAPTPGMRWRPRVDHDVR